MPFLLAKVENFARFEGEDLNSEPNMGFGRRGGDPHEMYNFSVASDGWIYGYLPKHYGRTLERLGGKKGADKVSNVTVIFQSNSMLCGYYTNATILSTPVRHPDRYKIGGSKLRCTVKVKPSCAFLIPVEKRMDEIPTQRSMSPVLYGDKNPKWVGWFKKFIKNKKPDNASEKKRTSWMKRIERSSVARKLALKRYGHTCECCKVFAEDDIRSAVFEVHHKVPYAENFAERKLDTLDLAVLCANCHRMIHKMQDVADITHLREYLKLN